MSRLQTIKFTVHSLEKLEAPVKGFNSYRDEKCIYLKLYVTAGGIKTFFVRTRVQGKDERIIIGRFPIISIELARKKAISFLAQVTDGKHPHEEKRKQLESKLSFEKHFAEYLERYSKPHKKTWAEDKRDIDKHVSHWYKRDLTEIRKSDIQKLHEKIFAESGRYQANKILIRLRAIFNKAIEWGWQGINPTNGIKKYKEKSRDRFVQQHEMPFLIRSLDEFADERIKDFLGMLFLTGARKTNLMQMRWQEINWDTQEWRIPMTKNGEPVIVALVARAVEILRRRITTIKSEWVFPQLNNNKRHIAEVGEDWKNVLAKATLLRWREDGSIGTWMQQTIDASQCPEDGRRLVSELAKQAMKENIILPPSLMDLRLHDIRRTFGSYQAMTGASLLTIGKSLGHRSTDATQVYARLSDQTVRESVEKATDAMFC